MLSGLTLISLDYFMNFPEVEKGYISDSELSNDFDL